MNKKVGKQTYIIENDIAIIGEAAIASSKEAEGPLGEYLDDVMPDIKFGQKSFEKGESRLLEQTMLKALEKSNKVNSQVDSVLTGDLLNQCISSNYAVRNVRIPFYGLYGACSTMAESMSLAAMLIDGGFGSTVMCGAGSHFYSSERQYRYPVEYGGQRTPTSQWTVTGSGMAVLEKGGNGPFVTSVTTGKVADKGITDANNMGAAMAPAAADTIIRHFKDMNTQPKDYDLIVTGDLGALGKGITYDLVRDEGYDLSGYYEDCGVMIFDAERQNVASGGSGCGCSAVVLCSYLIKQLRQKKINKLLFVGTGALMSPLSVQQGESIPGIAHAVVIENKKEV